MRGSAGRNVRRSPVDRGEIVDEARRFAHRAVARMRDARAQYEPGDVPLSIDALISPLRYDVVVRQQFLELLDGSWDDYRRDPEAFLEVARAHAYHDWFRNVAAVHIGVAGSSDPVMERAFARRVRRTAQLLVGWRQRGFESMHKVTVMAPGPATTATGKTLGARRYPLDGCHRLALLRLDGIHELTPANYRLRISDNAPIDNTHALLDVLKIDRESYLRFIASGYGLPPQPTPEALIAAAPDDARDEIAAIVSSDLPRIDRGTSGSSIAG